MQCKTVSQHMVPCQGCDTLFWQPPSYARHGVRFCSVTCRMATLRENRGCVHCTAPFDTLKSNPRRFCSRACSGAANIKQVVAVCIRCGSSGGAVRRRRVTPDRYDGAVLGFAGKLCNACYTGQLQARQRGLPGRLRVMRRASPVGLMATER